MNKQILLDNLRVIPDWPIKGVHFRDVTTMFKSPECIQELSNAMYDLYKDKGITKIVGIESRGFVLSSAAAYLLHAGIVLCRKPGKLPCETIQQSYAKEYGVDTIEIHKDAITPDDVVLLHDDLLATGGTMKAACDLVKKFHPKKIYCNFIIELQSEFPARTRHLRQRHRSHKSPAILTDSKITKPRPPKRSWLFSL